MTASGVIWGNRYPG